VACYSPLLGFRSRSPGKNGGFGIVFDRTLSFGIEMQVPCGSCIGCRLDRSREWAVRCVHEASLYESNCFVTLTYRPEDLPLDGSLVKWHFQDFMKRLRKFYSGRRVRFFHCGEYGEQLSRPHYHACLFNLDFEDKVFYKSDNDCDLFTSQILEDLWTFGFCTVGALTFESAAYCARYICKKVLGDKAYEHYQVCDWRTGELFQVASEYCTMSRRPGIGHGWYEKFGAEVFPSDEVILRGHVMGVPRYYEKIFELDDPEGHVEVKRKRNDFFLKHAEDCTPQRLGDREKCKVAQVAQLKRNFEEL